MIIKRPDARAWAAMDDQWDILHRKMLAKYLEQSLGVPADMTQAIVANRKDVPAK